jgi:hypothetical protein
LRLHRAVECAKHSLVFPASRACFPLLAPGETFVVPTTWGSESETVLRFCFVNPKTTPADVEFVLATLA